MAPILPLNFLTPGKIGFAAQLTAHYAALYCSYPHT
jgi:hypothetical protein